MVINHLLNGMILQVVMYRCFFLVGGGRDVICDVELCNVCVDDLMLISDLDVDVVLRIFCAFRNKNH